MSTSSEVNESVNISMVSVSDFNRLCQHWKAENWTWLRNFEMDVLIYKVQVVLK